MVFPFHISAGPPFCYKHGPEIREAKYCATNSLCDAQRAGGRIFKETTSITLRELAAKQVEFTNTYGGMSDVFSEALARSDQPGKDALWKGWQDITGMFATLYSGCIGTHKHLYSFYQRSRLNYDWGNYHDSISDVQAFLRQGGPRKEIMSFYGIALLEVGQYDEALQYLDGLSNHRAYIRFEMGDFASVIRDSVISGANYQLKSSSEYAEGLLQGLVEGESDSNLDGYTPCFGHSLSGLETTLWTVCQNPLSGWSRFVDACAEIATISVNLEQTSISETVKEWQYLVKQHDALGPHERGRLTGYLIGKYGINILTAGTTMKGVMAFKALQHANRQCLLEACGDSLELVAERALKHAVQRDEYFRNVEVDWKKQDKFVRNTRTSHLTYKDAETLVGRFAGSGSRIANYTPGCSGYTEKVEFGEVIGYFIQDGSKTKVPTSKGIIHYSKTGAYIVPAQP
ncbi:MAG: polymorphic toxin type 50 domain-containing protein [Chlamydiales bacterium]|nr:polymorphic toxin type 50 domain-containing protein [Chlamydiales bacterium]